MPVLEKAKKHLTIIGVKIVSKRNLPELLQQSQLTVNRIQIVVVTFLLGTYFISVLCTLIFKAKGFTELSNALLYCTIGLLHFNLETTTNYGIH